MRYLVIIVALALTGCGLKHEFAKINRKYDHRLYQQVTADTIDIEEIRHTEAMRQLSLIRAIENYKNQ